MLLPQLEVTQRQDPAKANRVSLTQAIVVTAQECGDSVEKRAIALDGSLFGGGTVQERGYEVDLSAASAVFNAFSFLTNEQRQHPAVLIKKLVEKQTKFPYSLTDLIKKGEGKEDVVTPQGFNYLLGFAAKNDSGKELSLKNFSVDDMGKAHRQLINGAKIVVLDKVTSHAFTVGGVIQKGEKVSWIAIAPDKKTEKLLQEAGAKPYPLGSRQKNIAAYGVDPRNLVDRIASPIWVVSR